MEKYLSFGIATKIVINNTLKEEEDLKEKMRRLGESIDLSLYNIEYTEKSIILEIKKDVFEKNAMKFCIEQWENIEYKTKFYIIRSFEIMDGVNFDKVIEESKMGLIWGFHFFNSEKVLNDISYIDTLGKSDISCDLFCYLLDAKISLQREECALNYLRNCIINSSHNPIKRAGVIAISENRN